MPDAITGLIGGGSLLGGILGSREQSEAAGKASDAQARAAQAGIDEQRRQFDAVQKLLAPYVTGGTGSLAGQQALLGLSGDPAQQAAIAALQSSPQMQALQQQGENAILQNASATGGLRGGNTQAALAQFRPQILSQLIESQFSKLGGLTSMGQASATGQAAMGQQTGTNVSNLLGDIGAARAGNALAQGSANMNMINSLLNTGGLVGGKLLGVF